MTCIIELIVRKSIGKGYAIENLHYLNDDLWKTRLD